MEKTSPLPGGYELLEGRFSGALDPNDPHNAIINDIKLVRAGDLQQNITLTRTLSAPDSPLPLLLRERREVQRSRTISSAEFARTLTAELSSPYLSAVARSTPVLLGLRAYWAAVRAPTSTVTGRPRAASAATTPGKTATPSPPAIQTTRCSPSRSNPTAAYRMEVA